MDKTNQQISSAQDNVQTIPLETLLEMPTIQQILSTQDNVQTKATAIAALLLEQYKKGPPTPDEVKQISTMLVLKRPELFPKVELKVGQILRHTEFRHFYLIVVSRARHENYPHVWWYRCIGDMIYGGLHPGMSAATRNVDQYVGVQEKDETSDAPFPPVEDFFFRKSQVIEKRYPIIEFERIA
jgi:hypothetical protein